MIEQQEMAGGSERFVPNDLYLNSTTAHTCCFSPVRTWAASRPICGRPRWL